MLRRCFAMLPAVISLTSPAMLWGLAFAAMPIVAHLLNRFARRQVVFPTLRFLSQSAASHSRLFRIRRWIVLALRCAFVAGVAAAFAQPVWFEDRRAESLSERAAAVVILLDASASTQQTSDGATAFERLRSQAARTLDALEPGLDVADVILVTDRPAPFFPRLSPNLPSLRDQLREAAPSFGRADFARGLSLASELLAAHAGPRRVVVLTDLQESNWSDALSNQQVAELLGWGTEVAVGEFGRSPPNVSLLAPRSAPPRPLLNQPAQVIVRVANTSDVPREVRLTMRVEGRADAAQTVSLAIGEEREVAFPIVWTDDALRIVEFKLSDDGLAADNAAWLVVRPAHRLPVLLVSDDDPAERGRGAYFLQRALAPLADDQDRFDVRVRRPADVAPHDLAECGVVFVDYVAEMPPSLAASLVAHVRSGGSVLMFAGDPGMTRALDGLDRAAGEGGVLPFAPAAVRDLSSSRDPLTIAGGRWRSRLLREFDEQSQLAFGQIRFHRVMLPDQVRPDADVLLTFSNDAPALAARQSGAGQLLVAGFSPDLASSDLARFGSFVALVQSLARELRPQVDAARSPVVGEPWRSSETVRISQGDGPPRLLDPNGAALPIVAPAESPAWTFELDSPRRPGVYRVETKRGTIAAAAVSLDAREGRLRQIPADDLARRLAPTGASPRTIGAGWGGHDEHRGVPLWPWLLAAALAAAALELTCLACWKR